jgi:hypothetical protein
MMKINKRERLLAYAIAGLIGAFLIEKFLFSDLRGGAKKIEQQIKVEEAKLRLELDLQKRKDSIASELKDYKPYLDSMEGISEREISAKFLKEAEKMAQEAGTSIVSLSPKDEPQDMTDYIKHDADFKAEGTLSQIINFVGKVQNSRLLIMLDKMSLSPKDEQAGTMKIEATLSLIVPKS